MTHVPFRGNSQASVALLSSQIDLVINESLRNSGIFQTIGCAFSV